ncbi:hypothetical protein SAMN05444484_108192 [Flavobacterium chilense]|uniref:Uncharacterized protein n=1 Tax=Flavobacterium chilense TaxID=946677 RepID=A0A1M7KYI8_9FLAO|nr:hypothetical protein SAMN05444484_108192 [Flavobacterium chilense]
MSPYVLYGLTFYRYYFTTKNAIFVTTVKQKL